MSQNQIIYSVRTQQHIQLSASKHGYMFRYLPRPSSLQRHCQLK